MTETLVALADSDVRSELGADVGANIGTSEATPGVILPEAPAPAKSSTNEPAPKTTQKTASKDTAAKSSRRTPKSDKPKGGSLKGAAADSLPVGAPHVSQTRLFEEEEFLETTGSVTNNVSAELESAHIAPSAPPVQLPAYDVFFAITLLGLASIEGLGRKGIAALLAAVEHVSMVWELEEAKIASILHDVRTPAATKIANRIVSEGDTFLGMGQDWLARLQEEQIYIIAKADLPERLRSAPSPPPWLFVQGTPEVLYHQPAVALVGTRESTPDGIKATRQIVEILANYPVTVVSGLAEGIDGAAHDSSLRRQMRNVAFLGHGINHEFPKSTVHLRHQIVAQGGAVATEYLPSEVYQKSYFVARNRLQAALADIVIPVEAKADGGTAHTVRFARQYKRQVVGVAWPGANGILPELQQQGDLIVNLHDRASRRKLEMVFRELAEAYHHKTYAFTVEERRLRTEMSGRDIRAADIRQLMASLEQEARRMEEVEGVLAERIDNDDKP